MHTERAVSFECLRLVAAVGIAVFHVFLPWGIAEVECALGPAYHPLLALFLGLSRLLGACGNHVFFLISGYFLLPRSADDARQGVAWSERFAQAARRSAKLLAAVVFWWVVVAIVVPLAFPEAEQVWLSPTWLATGLEFVWLYVVAVLISPVFGWLRAHQRSWLVPVAIGIAIYSINTYIAFVSPDDTARGLLSWRKQMSGVTYLYSFYMAAAIHDAVGHVGGGVRASWVPFAAALICTIAVEGYAAWSRSTYLLEALSYKSTSLFAFVLAAGVVYFAACRATREESQQERWAGVVCQISSSVLGFYVLQSLTWNQWNVVCWERLAAALAGGAVSFVLTGVLLALALVALYLMLDMLLRRPIFRP